MKQFISFVRKEFYHIFRDLRTMLILLGMPVVQIILFGFAITTEVKNVKVAVLDFSKDVSTRQIIDKLDASDYFNVNKILYDNNEIEETLRKSSSDLIIVFEAGFDNNLRHTGKARVQLIADATDPNNATILTSYASNSKKILFNISFSTKSELMMEEMNEVHDFMSKFGKDVETKWGLYIDESLEEQVKFTVLATGFGIKDVPGMDNMMNKRTIEEQKKLEELEEEEQRKDERRGDYYGKDTFKNSNKKKRHNIYIFSLEDLDNDDIISMVETTPTFQRTKTVLESIQSKAIAEEEETFNNDAENGGITITF